MFHRRGPGYALQRLSKLYSDTKEQYEISKVTPQTQNMNDSPDVLALRKDFQIQQDRLLAWGLHWTDVGAPTGKGMGGEDVDIDKKIDQAGLGEVVASVMSEIKRLLEESGRLQHPEKYEMARTGKSMRGPGSSPTAQRKEWTAHEVQTGRALLDQLTTCIDVLYSLVDEKTGKSANDTGTDIKRMKHEHNPGDQTDYTHLFDHPLHIDFVSLEFAASSPVTADPPPYDPTEGSVVPRDRSIAWHTTGNHPVMVDFLGADCPPYVVGSADDVFELHELGQKLCKHRSLSWCGHLRLIGFTVDPRGPRCGMVYALPDGHDHKSFQRHRTLGATIASANNQESSQPPLEDRFRLAYNLCMSVLGYFVHGETHQYINSGNIILTGSYDHARRSSQNFPTEIRSPYLVQSCQDFLLRLQAEEPFASTIYRHPEHDIQAQEIVPAYDIYSLGLLLLEIGLWIPLSKLWKSKYDRTIFMQRVQRIYSQKLASKCGSKFMRVVQKCLQAPTELQYRNNYEDAGAFLLEVAKELSQCCMLDEQGPPPSSDLECFELLIIEQICKSEAKAAAESKYPAPLEPAQIPPARVEPEGPHQKNSKRKADAISKPSDTTQYPLRKFPDLPIPQADLDVWNTLVMPKLGKILHQALHDSPESASLSLMMFGSTPETAKTTICVQCSQTAKIRDVLRKKFKPKRGWSVIILSGDVRRSGKRRRPRRAMAKKNKKGRKIREQRYQERPSSGASIGAFKDNEHLPPVSFGGTLLIEGEPFGMTVHHMLDTPSDSECDSESDDEGPRRSAAPRKSMPGTFNTADDVRFMQSSTEDLARFSDPDIDLSDDDFMSDAESETSTIVPDYAITDEDGNDFYFLDDTPELDSDEGSEDESDGDDDDDASVGDRPAVMPYSDDDFAVTQPAIDDVDSDFFPSEEDRDDDHLESHAFGFIYASSGIRRVTRGEMKHEIDWALIRVKEERLTSTNNINQTQSQSSSQNSTPAQRSEEAKKKLTCVTPLNKMSGLKVHCVGRTSGFKTGRISQAMSLVKFRGRSSFSTSFCVEGSFGLPGDSGAWVYDPVSGSVAGHVLAWSDKSRTSYIAPMEILIEDVKARLGVRSVCLPGSIEADIIKATRHHEDETMGSNLAKRLRGMRIDTSSAPAPENSPAKPAPVEQEVQGGGGRGKGGMDVRALAMAGAVS